MTAEFNITIPGAEIIKRLADLETANADLLDRLKQLELTVSANAHQQDALHDRFIALERDNKSIGAYVQRVETDSASASRVERLAEELGRLNARVADLNDRLLVVNDTSIRGHNHLSDAIGVLNDLIVGKIVPAPNKPVDTSWHPFNFSVDLRPDDDKRIVAMTRSGLIDGPFKAQHAYWDERGVMTIVAWRYAKEGE